MTLALRPVNRPVPAAQVARVDSILDDFLRKWPLLRPHPHLLGLVSQLNRCGWRCAVVDGGDETAAWRLLTNSGQNQRLQANSIQEGLLQLQLLQQSGQYDLIVLHNIPCSLTRLTESLAWAAGSGAVLWLRQAEAVLLEEKKPRRRSRLEPLGKFLDGLLRFLDRWG